jgi:hypothetical protein
MGAFQPRRPDGRSEWRVVFEHVRDGAPDQIFTYSDLAAALERPISERPRIQRAVLRANRELWRDCQRSLVNVPNVGYRVLRPTEHEIQAGDYQGRAQRRIGSAVAVMKAVDLQGMTEPQRQRALRVTQVLMNIAHAVDHHARKLAHHDQLIRELEDRIGRLESDRPD